jgi:hypothetical protein
MNWKRDSRTYWLILVGLTCFNWLSALAGSSNQPPKPVYLTLQILVPGTDVVRINTPDLFTLRPVDLLSQPLSPTGLTQVNLQLASPSLST